MQTIQQRADDAGAIEPDPLPEPEHPGMSLDCPLDNFSGLTCVPLLLGT